MFVHVVYFKISNIVTKGPINNKLSLEQVQLPYPKMTLFRNAYTHQWASLSYDMNGFVSVHDDDIK